MRLTVIMVIHNITHSLHQSKLEMHRLMLQTMQRCNQHRRAAMLILFEEADTEGSHEATCNTDKRTRLSQGGSDRR